MRSSIAGLAVSIFTIFLSLVVIPIYFMSIITFYQDVNRCQTAARNFVDTVIDNRQISDATMAELNINLAAVTTNVHATVYRETRVIDPDDTDGTTVKWVYTQFDGDTVWKQGDLVTIVIEQESPNLLQNISSIFLGSSYNSISIRLVGMVR